MKILVVLSTLKKGEGISEWVVNYYTKLVELHQVEVTICVENSIQKFDMATELRQFKVIVSPQMEHHPIAYINHWNRIAAGIGQYDFVHFHTDNLVKFYPEWLLRYHSNVVIHSHNSTNIWVTKNKVKSLLHSLGRRIVRKTNFYRFACSDLAAKWLYGTGSYFQVNNGTSLERMRFKENVRKRVRSRLNLNGRLVFGHVGRFAPQKNQLRLVQIFNEIRKIQPQSLLLLVGDGPDKERVRKLVESLNISDSVRMLGFRDDVNELMNAFDAIVFPSRYEGLPMALVEAQANGLPTFFADTITKEIKLLPQSQSFSLGTSDKKIASMVIDSLTKNSLNRPDAVRILKSEGYDESDVAEQLYNFYLKQNTFEKRSI